MLFSSFPPTCRCRGDTRDRLRKAEDRTKHNRSSAEKLRNKRVKLCGLRLLAEHDEALNHESEHPPRTSGVLLAATSEPRALFIQDFECASAIAGVRHLSKKHSDAESIDRAPSFEAAR